MKKLSLLFVLLLFGCQSLTKNIENLTQLTQPQKEQSSQSKFEIPPQPEKFETRNLGTQRSYEKKIQVALFLPMSGKNKDLGFSLFNAAVLSLFDNDSNRNIELILIDSKDTPQEAATAFKEVINRKIKIVIGPVFSTLVEAIEKDAKKNQITVISLSNNPELSGKINDDGGVFIAGMLLETQIDKIVSYALEQGKFSFAIIAPNNQYGNTVTATFKKIVKNRDGNFITSEFYQPNDPNLDRTVKRLISSFSVPERFKLKKEALANDSLRTYPQIIFIPESGKILSKIVASIKKQNTDERDFQIIGTNQWDDISTFNDRNLVGAWFATSENEKFRNFEKIYYQSYNKFPPRISSIVYDSVAAISSLIDSKKGQLPVISNFTNYGDSPKNGFEGIDGLFRFLPNGLVQRNLAVLQVGYGRFETISKPTEKFLKY